MQKWKEDPKLHSCNRNSMGSQSVKDIDYENTYKKWFLESDPVRDWESIERCKNLFHWAVEELDGINTSDWNVLDIGTKDGQFPEWLLKDYVVDNALGIEIASDYLEYAKSKNRPVEYGNVGNLSKRLYNKFDMVFSHHVLGLTPDYIRSLTEMWKCVKPGGFMLTLNDCPGNPKKHFSLIENSQIFFDFMGLDLVNETDPAVVFNDYWNEDYPKEWVLLMQKGE